MDLATVTYKEFKAEAHKRFGAIPLRFAFSDEQLNKVLKEWGLTKDNFKDKVVGVQGGMLLKTDKQKLDDFLKWENEISEILEKREDFMYQLFYYEFGNHEAHYMDKYEDVLDNIGEELNTDLKVKAFNKAKKDHWQWCIDNDNF